MKLWKKTMAAVLGSMLVLSQGMAFAAEEDMPGVGDDVILEKSHAVQQGAGIGTLAPDDGKIAQEGIAGSLAMGVGSDLGFFSEENEDVDTCVLEDIRLELRIRGSYMMVNSDDPGFYYIDTWGEHAIPNMLIGAFKDNTTEGFYDRYTENMRKHYPDITIVEQPSEVTIADKTLTRCVYNYGISGYTIKDTRYIWLGYNDVLYMFNKREVPDLDYMLGNQLEDIIAGATVMGFEAPQPETTAVPAPQPETTAVPAPQPETTAPPTGGDRLYVQNDDSSWAVTTKYFTMTIPPAWTGHFNAAVLENGTGYSLQVANKESRENGFGGHLFSIMLVPQGEDYTVYPSYDYLGTMDTPEGAFHVVVLYPTDVQTGDIWSEFYKILNGDKNSAITTMRPAAGVVWTLPDGRTISSEASAPQPETTVSQPDVTAPQPETTVSQPDVTVPQPETSAPAGEELLGTTAGTSYSNRLFGMNFNAPSDWILANQEQLVTLNEGLPADQFIPNIESGNPVCVAYAQSPNGMEIMNVVVMNGKPFMDASVASLTQDDVKAVLDEAVNSSTGALEAYGATVTGTSLNTVSCMGQTCWCLDITFDYGEYSGTQRQVGIPAGTYFALITARSVSGNNTQATLDMFTAA